MNAVCFECQQAKYVAPIISYNHISYLLCAPKTHGLMNPFCSNCILVAHSNFNLIKWELVFQAQFLSRLEGSCGACPSIRVAGAIFMVTLMIPAVEVDADADDDDKSKASLLDQPVRRGANAVARARGHQTGMLA